MCIRDRKKTELSTSSSSAFCSLTVRKNRMIGRNSGKEVGEEGRTKDERKRQWVKKADRKDKG